MSNVAISVDGLSKAYRISHGANGARSKNRTLREDLADFPKRLISRLTANSQSRSEEFWALKDVCFEVKKGDVLGIIGRNGAGKSTLLKILSRITEPTSGEARVYGRVGSLLEVGTGFHPELTGRENVFLNGAILGMTRAEIRARFDEIVAFSGVERFLDTPVKHYSSGMYVRLAFAVAAHLDTEILLVDEVLAVGDAEFQKKCLGKMNEVAQTGRTVVFVSHDLAAISRLTSVCVYIAEGRVSFVGSTPDTIHCYVSGVLNNELSYSSPTSNKRNKPGIRAVKLKTSLAGNVQINQEPFEVSVTIETPTAIEGACLSIQIYDSEQINYAHLWVHDVSQPICRAAGIHVLTCRVPKLRLYMGHYRLRLIFTEPPGGATFQILEGVCPFEVIMPDKSRLFQWWPRECAYLEDCDWDASTRMEK
jgi:lipopolysaccharide transport system ATP-binding protein